MTPAEAKQVVAAMIRRGLVTPPAPKPVRQPTGIRVPKGDKAAYWRAYQQVRRDKVREYSRNHQRRVRANPRLINPIPSQAIP